jgi:ribosome biogenesis ATPase
MVSFATAYLTIYFDDLSGKTHLANAVAGQLGVPYFRVSAPELVAGMSGESEGRIRDLFQAASSCAPSLIFMDELDVIAAKRSGDGGGRGMEKRMVAQLLTSMDSVSPANNRNNCAVVVIAATNRPDAMDPALRRAGRFDREILLGVPDEEARERMIGTMTSKMRLYGDFDCKVLARKTPGYVGADIKSLAKEAAVVAIDRIFRDVLRDDNQKVEQILEEAKENVTTPMADIQDTHTSLNSKRDTTFPPSSMPQVLSVGEVIPLTTKQMEPLYVTMDDFLAAIPLVQPSAKREGFAIIPDVTWNDVGALQAIRQDLKMSVLEPIRNPERFKQLGLPLPAGVMLYGPPGCGKTLLAKAIANESGANFISVKGPELLDKYVGESERSVRLVFERARSSSPCIIFFDELDSLVPRRGSGGDGGGGVSERVVNQLLTEMDGLESRRSVFVIAATNRPELIDPAMMRPGRLDKLLYVPLPTAEERVHIIRALASKIRLHPDVDLACIAMSPRADGYSGADCSALLREAGLAVLKENMDATTTNAAAPGEDLSTLCIASRHFDVAFTSVMPSVSKSDQARYDRIRNVMARARSRGNEKVDDNSKAVDNQTTS